MAFGLARFGADVAIVDIQPARCASIAVAVERMGRSGLALPSM